MTALCPGFLRHAPGCTLVESPTKRSKQVKYMLENSEEEGPSRTEVEKEDKTHGTGESEGDTCGGSDINCAHLGCERNERVQS